MGVAKGLVGKVCMFRTYSAGVHFGKLTEREGKECLIADSRRVFYWTEACSLSQLAIDGSKDIGNCKISVVVPEIFLSEVIEIIPMSDNAKEILYGAEDWKR